MLSVKRLAALALLSLTACSKTYDAKSYQLALDKIVRDDPIVMQPEALAVYKSNLATLGVPYRLSDPRQQADLLCTDAIIRKAQRYKVSVSDEIERGVAGAMSGLHSTSEEQTRAAACAEIALKTAQATVNLAQSY
jgi:hypothetical protein